VFVVIRTIVVRTEDLWDAAKRYERLANGIEDVSSELHAASTSLFGAYSRDDFTARAGTLNRKSGSIAYRLRDLGGKLMFAANRYEEADRRIRQSASETEQESADRR